MDDFHRSRKAHPGRCVPKLRYPALVQVCDYEHFKANPYVLPCRYYIAHKPFFYNFIVLLLLAGLPLLIGFIQVRMSVKNLKA